MWFRYIAIKQKRDLKCIMKNFLWKYKQKRRQNRQKRKEKTVEKTHFDFDISGS